MIITTSTLKRKNFELFQCYGILKTWNSPVYSEELEVLTVFVRKHRLETDTEDDLNQAKYCLYKLNPEGHIACHFVSNDDEDDDTYAVLCINISKKHYEAILRNYEDFRNTAE